MPKKGRNNNVTYMVVDPADEHRVRKLLEQAVSGSGVTVESYHARVDDKFPEVLQSLSGQRKVFFCSSDDSQFNFGHGEMAMLSAEKVTFAVFRDSRDTLLQAAEKAPALAPPKKP